MLFLDRLHRTCLESADKTAIEFREDGAAKSVSYGELLAATARTAGWLRAHGVEPGDRVAVCLPKSLAAIHLHLAACSIGAISLPLNSAYSAAELDYLLRDSEAALFVTCGETAPVARAIVGIRAKVVDIHPGRFGLGLTGEAEDLSRNRIDPEQTALMLYTSGTTGQPKGACLSHRSLTANMDMLGAAWEWSPDDVLLHALPLFHVHGLLVALHGALHAGATAIVHAGFDTDDVLHCLRGGDCSVFMGVPTMYRRLLEAAGSKSIDLQRMRLLTSGSDRLPIESFQRIEEQFGIRVVERYGMTETGIMTSNPLRGDRVAGQVGLPLPNVEMRVADPDSGLIVPDGEVGEFQTRGPHLFSGYWRDDRKTASSFTEDGWFRTGDLGVRDSNGRFELKGRATDLVISGGFNVYPSEVERVLATHPAVAQCAVVGMPDPDWGEAVTAFVVRAGEQADAGQLIAHCRASLTSYKTPKRVVFVDRLPRNAMGKVRKADLPRWEA